MQNSIFDNEYPLPYREVPSRYLDDEENEMDKPNKEYDYTALSRELIRKIAKGEAKYITDVCSNVGMQLAILEILTRRFDEKTLISKGLPVTYDIEVELLDNHSKPEKIKVSTKKGSVYKEEIALLIAQIKYQVLSQVDDSNKKIESVKKKMKDYYKKHCNRVKKADQMYLEFIKNEIADEKEKDDTDNNRITDLKKEKKKVSNRIKKRQEITQSKDLASDKIAKKRFIKIPGLMESYHDATEMECLSIIDAFKQQYKEVNTSEIPDTNRLYVNTANEGRKKYSELRRGKKQINIEKTKEEKGQEH